MQGTVENSKITLNTYPLEFRGNGREYFRIWIVNLFLSIVTIGIYSAWATVRQRRYFYSNTFLDGNNFDYHGSPIAILHARIVAVILIAIISIGQSFTPLVSSIAFIIGVLLYPWIINMAWNFQLRNTEYRNIRFQFEISHSKTYLLQTPLVVAIIFFAILTLYSANVLTTRVDATSDIDALIVDNKGFFMLYAISLISLPLTFLATRYATKRHLTRSSSYGHHRFSSELKVWYMMLYLVVSGIMFSPLFITASFELDEDFRINLLLLVVLALLALVISQFSSAFYQVRTTNHWLNTARLKDLTIQSNLKLLPYFGILLSNVLLIIMTAGLFYPFAQTRRIGYIMNNIQVLTKDLQHYSGDRLSETRALGEELTDVFGIEVGF